MKNMLLIRGVVLATLYSTVITTNCAVCTRHPFGPRLCKNLCRQTFGCSTYGVLPSAMLCRIKLDPVQSEPSMQGETDFQYIRVKEDDILITKKFCTAGSKLLFTRRNQLTCVKISRTYSKQQKTSVAGQKERFDINLTSGVVKGSSDAIEWKYHLSGSGSCAKYGLLKLSFGKPGSRNRKYKVQIDMEFLNPRGWLFNIGESWSNSGDGGDMITLSKGHRDSEVVGEGSTFSVFGNEYAVKRLLYRRKNIIKSRFTITIADGLVLWNNWKGESRWINDTAHVFSLNGEAGRYATYDIYFAMNTVIRRYTGKRGKGLCGAVVTWL